MKKIITAVAIAFSAFLFSQVSTLLASSPKGTIVTTTNQSIEFKDLKFEKGKIVYTDKNTNLQEFLYDNSVKSMSYYDSDGNLKTYQAQGYSKEDFIGSAVVPTENKKMNSNQSLKLTDDNEIKAYLANNSEAYKKGKKLNNLGTAFVIGGATCAVVGGILNLTSSSETPTISNQTPKSNGSPVPIIIGLVGAGAGAIMKISGHSQMKKAMQDYKTAGISKVNTTYYALADAQGFGVKVKF